MSPHLKCVDCGAAVNPIEWIAVQAEDWARVTYLYKQLREAQCHYEAKKKCRCEHCGKVTHVRPATAAQVRELKAAQS